jgi:hypothetical protein
MGVRLRRGGGFFTVYVLGLCVWIYGLGFSFFFGHRTAVSTTLPYPALPNNEFSSRHIFFLDSPGHLKHTHTRNVYHICLSVWRLVKHTYTKNAPLKSMGA